MIPEAAASRLLHPARCEQLQLDVAREPPPSHYNRILFHPKHEDSEYVTPLISGSISGIASEDSNSVKSEPDVEEIQIISSSPSEKSSQKRPHSPTNAEQHVRKKNPYSIEELLKKPTRIRESSISPIQGSFHQPCGVLIDNVPKSSCHFNSKDSIRD